MTSATIARADAVKGSLFYTTFSGGENVWSVGFNFDGTTFSLGASTGLAATNGADGLVFDPTAANRLLVGGQSQNNLAQVNTAGGITGNVTVGAAGQSYHLAITPGSGSIWNMANGGSPFISIVSLPLGAGGTSFPVTGDDTDIRGVAFIGNQAYYGTAADGSISGNFGKIEFDGTKFITTRLLTDVPAHGLTFDPFTGDLIISSGPEIEQLQIVGSTITQIGPTFDLPGSQFDQTAVDGLGHLFAASNAGNMVFIDYNATSQIGSASNFSNSQFLAFSLDDIAPLSSLGGPHPVPEPATLLLLAGGLAAGAGLRKRMRRCGA